jgi:hypothetical protein
LKLQNPKSLKCIFLASEGEIKTYENGQNANQGFSTDGQTTGDFILKVKNKLTLAVPGVPAPENPWIYPWYAVYFYTWNNLGLGIVNKN